MTAPELAITGVDATQDTIAGTIDAEDNALSISILLDGLLVAAPTASPSGAIAQSGANTVITLDSSDSITLLDTTATSLTSSQFEFS